MSYGLVCKRGKKKEISVAVIALENVEHWKTHCT